MNSIWKYFLTLLLLIVITTWLAVLEYKPNNLKIIACDVGQGDATLLVYGKTDILFDGGPDKKVLTCLSKHIPFWDKEIEIVVLTHPQADHYKGLIDIYSSYKVSNFMTTGLNSGNQDYQVLRNEVGGGGSKVIGVAAGSTIRFGLIRLDIVNPSKEFIAENSSPILSFGEDENMFSNRSSSKVLSAFTSRIDTNAFSLVSIVSYKNFKGMITGDIDQKTSDLIADRLGGSTVTRTVNYIKIPHHGSKNGITAKLLEEIHPWYATISVGKNNSYGHPSPEIIKMLDGLNISYKRTDEVGDIVLETDGEKVWFLKN